MEEILTLERSLITRTSDLRRAFIRTSASRQDDSFTPVRYNIIAEGGENFLDYLNWLGLGNEPNTLVLPLKNHYYYGADELKGVTTLINLKRLNLIRHLDSFIHVVCQALSPTANFIGCFTDRKNNNLNGRSNKLYKRLINFLDDRREIEIDKNDVSILFEQNGYKVADMTEIKGLTYFNSIKITN